MRVALIQMAPSADRSANILQAQRLVSEAVKAEKPDLVVLPEIWSCLGGAVAIKQASAELLPTPGDTGGVLYEALRAMAREHNIWVHGGSIGELCGPDTGGKLANTSLVFSPRGEECGRYRKIHLFDVVTPNGDGYRESDNYVPGETIEVVDIDDVPTGLAICYDLRFAELFLALRAANVEMIILPAAFTQQTGEAHWDILVRARAIEAQAWVIACGTTGWHVDGQGNQRQTYGHSMIVSPWGEVVLQLGSEEGWGVADLDMDEVRQVRQRMPVQANRRLI
ncbi:nitrilase/cyanide hydratase and apolipoprotein N-acyltransferase [Gluconobacter japonicus]|uniref:carbon-nitrogen hydrolase family protein n=1 Tax=Gluconobacter frateurii TaxID=38308 RepID=UPI0007C78FDA|nr:carbon-nitrogen hydrolase family protein [Gluconobacter frateurii]OAG72080.1 nitrilase/cyanide hydratase and apolipoprotein N-acyltransferase [Gluconobacter japonicus]UMM08916.1 carbon-nitrogen hydrolase family protein [Gluconobacter frateurii]